MVLFVQVTCFVTKKKTDSMSSSNKNIVGYRQQVSFEDEYQHNIAIKLARWIGEDATGYVLLCLVVIIISFFMFIQCDYHCLICHSAIIRDIDDPHHEQTISMDDIYEIKGDIKQLNQGDKIYAILCGWNGGYLSEYRLATFEGITNNNKIIIQYKYIQQCVSIERKINIPTSDGSINVPSIIFAESIKPTNKPPPNKKFRGDYNINHNNSNAKYIPFDTFTDLFPNIASFLNINEYIKFKLLGTIINDKFKSIEGISELNLMQKIVNWRDYKFYNDKLNRCKYLQKLCVDGKDLCHHPNFRLKIPESITTLKIFGKNCSYIHLDPDSKLNITHLQLFNFGNDLFNFIWRNLDRKLFANCEYLYLTQCNFDDEYISSSKFDIKSQLPKQLRGFCNFSCHNWNLSLLKKVLNQYSTSLESFGCTDSYLYRIRWFDKVQWDNLKQLHFLSAAGTNAKILSIISKAPLLEKIHIQDVRSLIRENNYNTDQRDLLNTLITEIYKLKNLNEIKIIDSCSNAYAIKDSLQYALYDNIESSSNNNSTSQCIRLSFVYFVSTQKWTDMKQIYINCEGIVKIISGYYGMNFRIVIEYRSSAGSGVALKDIIKSYEKQPDFLQNRFKCINNNICVKVQIEGVQAIKFFIYSRGLSYHKLIGNNGHWIFNRVPSGQFDL